MLKITRCAWFAFVIAAGIAVVFRAPVLAQGETNWMSLFDGTSLAGWSSIGTANWRAVDGVIEANSGNGYLITETSYGDFQLTVDFWATPDANSGVFIRCADPKTITLDNSYEINIFDTRPDQKFRTGAIVNVASPSSVINTGNKWNSFDITARGSRFTIVLNGTTVVDNAEDSKVPRGAVGLQYGAGTVRFRNLRIRPL